MIAGLEHPTSGGIYFDDAEVSRLPASRRNVGLVFQDYAIFPHMTIFDNLAFGLRVRKVPAAEVRERVGRMAEFLKLTASLDASPRVLSLSEIQRVAIGRTLLTRPAILLLDEPLSNLEASVRNELRVELKRLHMETGYTTIYRSPTIRARPWHSQTASRYGSAAHCNSSTRPETYTCAPTTCSSQDSWAPRRSDLIECEAGGRAVESEGRTPECEGR